MDDDQIRSAIARARSLTEDLEEPYRSLGFRAVLESLLRGNGLSASPSRPSPSPVGLDLVEFLAAKKAETHPDRVVAIAYYAYRTSEGSGVTTKELTDSYSRARVKKPQNFPDVIAACVRKGYLVEGERREGAKSWVITRTGEAHVEQDL